MPHKERKIQIWVEYDPDLAKAVKKTKRDTVDDVTGEEIPAGSASFILPIRAGRNLVNARVSEGTYQNLLNEDNPEEVI